MLCAFGAIAGLALAGFGLFTAHGTRTAGVPPEDVAVVNQVAILRSDYIGQLRSLYDVSLSEATARQKRQVLEDMIREELYVQRGIELGMPTDTIEVRTALVGAVEAQASSDAAMAQPTAAELTAWFERHASNYASEGHMELTDLVMPNSPNGDAATAALRSTGMVPATLRRFGLKSSGRVDDGDEFYFAAQIHLGDRLFAAARQLADGAVSAPVAMPDGLHILVMKHNQRPVSQNLRDVLPQVRDDYIKAEAARLTAANERFLRKRADIQIAEDFR